MWREARCLRPQSERRLRVPLSAGMLTDGIWKYKHGQTDVIMQMNGLHAQHFLNFTYYGSFR